MDAPEGSRNGDGTRRPLTLGGGTITGRRPRGRGLAERVVSRVLPLCKRRTPPVGERRPRVDLHGVALGDVELALRGLLGEGAPLSPAARQRLKAQWPQDDDPGKTRRLDAREVVDVWADGLSGKAGLADSQAARRVLIGALTDGRQVVLAVACGQRASKASWGAGLPGTRPAGVRARGLTPWRGTLAQGHRGIGAAVAEQQPTAAAPRWWTHRIRNVLEALPNSTLLVCYAPWYPSQPEEDTDGCPCQSGQAAGVTSVFGDLPGPLSTAAGPRSLGAVDDGAADRASQEELRHPRPGRAGHQCAAVARVPHQHAVG